jgi:ATP-dependent Clp protease ATP-binding subunit ClpA
VIFYSVHYAREAGSGYIEPEHILEGLLLEDPQLFKLILPEKPNLVSDLKDELTNWREKPPATEKRDLPLSPNAKQVVAEAGTGAAAIRAHNNRDATLTFGAAHFVSCNSRLVSEGNRTEGAAAFVKTRHYT